MALLGVGSGPIGVSSGSPEALRVMHNRVDESAFFWEGSEFSPLLPKAPSGRKEKTLRSEDRREVWPAEGALAVPGLRAYLGLIVPPAASVTKDVGRGWVSGQ